MTSADFPRTPVSGILRNQSLAIATVFWVSCYSTALRHVMWRDEWQPLVTARDTANYAEFLQGIEWWGMNGFFSFCWLIQQAGLGLWFFKLVLVTIIAIGVYAFCRWSPFSIAQNALFAFGYFPFYEYGSILRNYGIILTTSIIATAIISSSAMNPLAFGLCLAAMPQTNAFGLAFCLVFGPTYLYELHRRGRFTRAFFAQPSTIAGLIVAAVGMVYAGIPIAQAVFTAPDWVAAAGTGGNVRTDSHFNRLLESLVFPARGWLPIPLFGTWNSHFLDPWPWAQLFVGAGIFVATFVIVSRSPTGLLFFGLGLASLGALFSHVPWTAMRYHGHFYVVLVLAIWLTERLAPTACEGQTGAAGWLRRKWQPMLTGLLVVHAVVGLMFVMQEQAVPFSGSREAARIIHENEPSDVLVIGDVDAWMTSLSGYLGRPVYIASRRDLGSYVMVDRARRWTPLGADELAAVVQERLAAERRDVVLVTNYPLQMPEEFGKPLGVVDRSITDERYFIFRIRYRRPEN